MTAKQLKNSILQMAVQGKLVPQNPADEPASVLLEKITKEKERLVKAGKIKPEKNPSRIFRGGEVEGTEKGRFYEQVGNGKVVDITDELPFEIPESWEWARLGTISGLISGRDLETRYFNDKKNGIPYITGASNIENDKIYVNRWTDNPCCIAQRGDLLFVCKGTVGKMAFLQEEKVHIARQIMAIRNLYTLHFLYIYYFIKYYIESIQKNAKGIIPGISRESLLDCLIPLPPLNEQTRIASKIDSLLPHISA